MRYVAKPVEIEAWLWTGNHEDLPESEWASGAYTTNGPNLIIDTLEGPSVATPHSHYAAVGTKGERYPIRSDIFAEKYEVAS